MIDIGSARTKLLIATRQTNGELHFSREKYESLLSAALDGRIIPPAVVEQLESALQRLVTTAAQAGCKHMAIVATEVFRYTDNGLDVLQRLQNVVGTINLIDARTEGILFYVGLRDSLRFMPNFCAMDVGGGSVQVVWEDAGIQVCSLPSGTLRLERQFQSGSVATTDEITLIRRIVWTLISHMIPPDLRRRALFVGSTCMYDFFDSALCISRGYGLDHAAGLGIVSVEEVRRLAEKINSQSDKLERYFPANPEFMRGVDKALMNVIAVAELVGAQQIIPTNESVSSAIARLLLSQPDTLPQYGIKTVKVLTGPY